MIRSAGRFADAFRARSNAACRTTPHCVGPRVGRHPRRERRTLAAGEGDVERLGEDALGVGGIHRAAGLRDQRLADRLRRLDAGQPLVEALVVVREPLVVDAQQVQDRRVEVADVERVLDDVVAEVVRLAVDRAPLRPAAGHPHVKQRGWWSRP